MFFNLNMFVVFLTVLFFFLIRSLHWPHAHNIRYSENDILFLRVIKTKKIWLYVYDSCFIFLIIYYDEKKLLLIFRRFEFIRIYTHTIKNISIRVGLEINKKKKIERLTAVRKFYQRYIIIILLFSIHFFFTLIRYNNVNLFTHYNIQICI